tara:strand:+ start:2587 stop:2778 length:192 start_codon:yes stop_codon:yes gene_type:complete
MISFTAGLILGIIIMIALTIFLPIESLNDYFKSVGRVKGKKRICTETEYDKTENTDDSTESST